MSAEPPPDLAAGPFCPACNRPLPHGRKCLHCLLEAGLDEPAEGTLAPESTTAGFAGGVGGAEREDRFQHYRILSRPDGSRWELGRGGMGVTYKAFDANLRCPVALKVVHRELLVHPVIRERFLREARLTARLRHPNVASILHLGARGGECFYAMEFIEGETLEELVRRHGPFAPARALDLCLQVARALGAAEKLQLVHRDIKPPNLMLTSSEGGYEHVKLIDFGVALWLDPLATGGNPRLTDAGLIGTPSFASPEQLQGDAVDARADFYSLGVTLWFLLAGHPPFAGGALQVIGQHLHREPPFGELETVNAPEPLVALARSLLKKNPADRPQNAAELRRSIERCSQALAGHATSGTANPRAATSRRVRPD